MFICVLLHHGGLSEHSIETIHHVWPGKAHEEAGGCELGKTTIGIIV